MQSHLSSMVRVRTAVLVAALPALACTTVPQETLENTRTIAVLSSYGNDLEMTRDAILRFNVEHKTVDIGLSDNVERIAAELLSARFTVRAVVVDKSALAEVMESQEEHSIFTTPIQEITALIPNSEGIDGYLIFHDDENPTYSELGHGLEVIYSDIVRQSYTVIGYSAVTFVDARENKTVTRVYAPPLLIQEAPASVWPQNAELEYDEAQKE